MAIKSLINAFVCDTYAEVLTLPAEVSLAFCKEAGRQCFYYNNAGTWTRIAGKFTSLDASAPLSMASGVLGFDSAQFATAAQGGKADSAIQSLMAATLVASGLMSAADFANLQFLVSLLQFSRRPQVVKHSVSIGTANSDALILTANDMPAKYLITRLSVFNASSALSTVSAGLYTSPNGVGAIVGPSTITAANATVFFDFSSLALTVRTNTPLYFHVATPKAGTTISVLLEFLNLT